VWAAELKRYLGVGKALESAGFISISDRESVVLATKEQDGS
jgi:hypothetical protein